MERQITLHQANSLTQARYNFSVVEKRAVYFIIREVRKKYIEKDGPRDLFDDLIIHLDTNSLQKSDSSLREVYNALKELRRKSIWIEDKDSVLELGYINYFHHQKHNSFVEVQVSHKLLPFLVELAEQYTSYNLAVAISLKTKYGQRFYEYCSQFRNSGFFVINVADLRSKLMLGSSYPRYALLKKYVIEPAKKELKTLYDNRSSDLYFSYSEVRKGRSVLQLKFYIHIINSEINNKMSIDDKMYYVKQKLYLWLSAKNKPKNKEWISVVVNHLLLNPDKTHTLYNRLLSITNKEPTKNHAALARHIIEEDILE